MAPVNFTSINKVQIEVHIWYMSYTSTEKLKNAQIVLICQVEHFYNNHGKSKRVLGKTLSLEIVSSLEEGLIF